MAYTRPKNLDDFVPYLSKPDTKFRLQVGTDILAYLADPNNSMICQDIGGIVDGLIPWMSSSNYKVSSHGIEVMTYLIDRLGVDFRPYIQTVLPNVIDRLGDAKDTVREKAQLLLLKLLERSVLSPQILLEKLSPGFTHKNAKIREETLRCLLNILSEHGAQSLTLSRFIPDIVKLLSDPTATVRDTAFTTLVDLYKHVGEKLRVDLQRRNLVPQSKWPTLNGRFDEARENGELLPTATAALNYNGADEIDRMPKPVSSVKKTLQGTGAVPKSNANNVLSRIGSVRKLTAAAASMGCVDEDIFEKQFEDVPVVRIFTAREVADQMKNVLEIISDTNKDWNKRVEALKKIRSLVIAGAVEYEDFHTGLKQLEFPMQATVKDLRSQVVREGCITIAYLSQTLGPKFDRFAEILLTPLINLIQNSAKIMSTSGMVAVKFIIRSVHNPRLIPIVTSNVLGSKSKDIRRSCCEFLGYILNNWPPHTLEKHITALQDAVKKGVADADPEARVSSRQAFRGLKLHFPDHAECLLQSLEPSYRRALQGEGMSASSSNSNLSSGFKSSRNYGRGVTAPQSTTGSTESLCGSGVGVGSSGVGGALQRAPSLPRTHRGQQQRSGIPVLSRDNSGRKGFRSNSAIDLQAAQRAKARAQYAAMARNKVAAGTASLQGEVAQQARPRKSPAQDSPERLGRTRTRNSQSQPTSRSGSPSSRLAYLYNRSTDHESSPRPRRLSSGIPRSTTASRETSRETSPNRSTLGRFRRSGSERPPLSPAARPVLAQRILQQSREAENALADVLVNDSGDAHRTPRRSLRSLDNHSDESETSSVCSERSFDSFRRPTEDINQIIEMCASTNWQDRKDGLLSLQYYLSTDSTLSINDLKALMEIFTKMFMDSHTKGFSIFLDTLHEVIKCYRDDLHSWIYVLLQRVFLKIGTETLNSVQSKLMTTLEVFRQHFPIDLLIINVYRFLMDATQTPNLKVKIVVLTFLAALFNATDGSAKIWTDPVVQVLQKVILMSQDGKSVDVRYAAKSCLLAMWNCNTAKVTMLLAELPNDQQDVAREIMSYQLRKNSTSSEPGSPMVNLSPKPLSPGTPPSRSDMMDHDEIYRSLRKTTTEIQNYSYEVGSQLDRQVESKDSGISQMSSHDMNGVTNLEDRLEELNLNGKYYGGKSGASSLPPCGNINGVETDASNGYKSLGDMRDVEVLKNIFDKCLADHPTPPEEKRVYFEQFIELIRQGQTKLIVKDFKKLLRLLIDNLNIKDAQTKCSVLEVLTAIFKNRDLQECWSGFVELLTLRVLEAHSDETKEVVKMAEQAAAAMSVVCPLNTIMTTLAPLLKTHPCPPLPGTLKMLTKLVETNPKDITDDHLAMIMPSLVEAVDHKESPVRKCAVFCIVALHFAVGEKRLEQFIAQLSYSRRKLLKLYICRNAN